MTCQDTDNFNANNKKLSSYGSWPSDVSAELIVGDNITIDEPIITADSVYYIERRPRESGRCVIVKARIFDADESSTASLDRVDLLPKPYSARSRVHEYGGGSYCLNEDNKPLIFFVNDKDQNIYKLSGKHVNQITHSDNKRFADFIYDNVRHQLIAICETHENEDVINSIVCININSGEIKTLIKGHDFYASPRLNATATQLCWQSWNHPNMPWDGNQLWLADIDHDGVTGKPKLIAGDIDVSVCQPQWSPDDVLHYISDDTGWWHLYRYHDHRYTDDGAIPCNEKLSSGEKEFGLPQWVFAQSTYAFIDNTTIICCYRFQGKTTLATLSLDDDSDTFKTLTTITTPWQEYNSITAASNSISSTSDFRFCFIAASDQCFPQLVVASMDSTPVSSTSLKTAFRISTDVIQTSCSLPVSHENYSQPQTFVFTNRHGKKVYSNYYPPTNPGYSADEYQQPPLITICHGGPTGQATTALDPKKQFWTSRGFALLDVNYSGSTGYGREYRLRLNNRWGQLDVEDCCDAALYAVSQKLADNNRLIIRGSSAGGYTVLSALTFQTVFTAGASYYGISELCSLATDTHKFEAHYLDHLIGPYPDKKQHYEDLSPINHTEQLKCPVIFFQGIEDRVVPKAQAEKMFEALDEKGVPVAAQYFEGEQHGFRKAETVIQSLENELSFYQLIFELKPKAEISFKGDIQLKNV